MISIASTTDNNMAIPLAVEYASILENNQKSQFDFYIVKEKLSQQSINLLQAIQDIYPNCHQIRFLEPLADRYQNANTNSPDSDIINAYYRIEIPLEVNVPRILYLDADMICCGNIDKLWQTDLHGHAFGAAEDSGYVNRLKEMGISKEPGRYFNSGLLLIDVKKWNQEQISQRSRKIANDEPKLLKYQDQDALNAVVDGDWERLDPKYNLQTHLVRRENGFNPIVDRRASEAEAIKHPIIIHYNCFDKPWISRNNHLHPLRKYYFAAKNQLIHRLANFIKKENSK
ncbi:general stress protein A [Fructilactobacillus lindneri]|uniref:GspA n=2 Tax=Fructilactobacillus lindneri TaxID=53444 RepID=A0A0R2JTF3_9LACO|nr:glycosyltransferase family 8 protein [Fructilactobacillus lindneri]ANZ57877.1 general stress protein A [Fructilactobacillus lindneri]ANZ59146.1 general stress protein A [Fructilactobacillus lindneri]KRN78661.1 GspA [Fructilactobacillus lindneri DSM 20690 = JCM 11027]POH01686.1 general stress protein A [Fructilactobacillus lindneri]POH03529.1 general stress protein A [Fructilactobacillus lindneri]